MQHSVRFGIRCSQHHREWSEIKEWFQAAENWGFESAWVFDHIIPLSDPRTGPNLDGWTLLAGLAEATSTIEIGPMVTGITYRNPALLLKMVTTVDHISNGRVLLGVGAAWFEGEHEMFGYDFPRAGDRVSMLREALKMFKMLQSQDKSTFDGKFYQLKEAIFEPKPVRNPMPLVVGGSGDRMLRIIGQFADQWDNNFRSNDEYQERAAKVNSAAETAGRDPSEIRRSTTLPMDSLNDPDALRQRMEELKGLGITDFLVHVPNDITPEVRTFAEELVPELKKQWG
ncbi:MAG: TIGR03560 family F420-dependent LLM class oxidoreductase [Chloroflexia bacterium]|nr:TIGR03560 family F420-dependent LLM class oxidoreductase [Chloroflexia bacterium]